MPLKPLDEMEPEELEAIMRNQALLNQEPEPEAVPEPPAAPESVPEPQQAPEPVQEPAAPMEAPETPQEPTLAEIEKRQNDLRIKTLEDELALRQAHMSRLAGKLGFLEQKLRTVQSAPATEPQAPEWPGVSDPRVASLHQELERIKQERQEELRDRAIAAEIASFQMQYREAKYTPEEINAAAAKYTPLYEEAQSSETPETAREMMRAVLARTATEIESRRLQAMIASAKEKSAQSRTQLTEAKRQAGISGSGAGAPPPTPPKPLSERSVDELERMLAEMTRK